MDQEPESEFTMMNEEQEHEFYPVLIQINIDDEDASVNDPFLNLLCYDNKDDDVVDGESLEDWSASEHNWSASEENEEDEDMKYPSYDPNVDWKLVKPILAMKFESPSQLKEMLIDYGVANGYQLVFTINDHNRMLVRCGTEETINDETGNIKKIWKCPFRLWASRVRDEDSFQIKTLNDQHTCSRQFSLGSLVTFSWIAKRYSKQIIQNPEISLRTMQQDIMTDAEHRQCTRHIYANFKKSFRGLQFKNLFWAAAGSTSKQWFDLKMEELKTINQKAYDHLIERDPTTWSRAFFKVGRACDAFENGMSESFNSRIRVARRKPIITMLEEIRTFVMRRMFLMTRKSQSFEHDVCPRIRKKLEEIKKKQRYFNVIPSGNNIFEVKSERNAYVVKIQDQTCTCGSWQLAGIPCAHSVAALGFINKDPESYVSHFLKKDMFKKAYEHSIKPLKGSMHWPKTDDIKPLPPKQRRMPGRPTVKRKKDHSEKENKKIKVAVGRKMTCKNCQGNGHNIRSCKNEKKDPPPKEARRKGRNKKT